MLIAAVLILGFTVLLGLTLGGFYLLRDTPPAQAPVIGWAHGAAGAIGLVVLWQALGHAQRTMPQGASAFGSLSALLLVVAFLGGLVILVTHLRRRPVSLLLVAMHGSIGIAGYILLSAYFSSPVSYRAAHPALHETAP